MTDSGTKVYTLARRHHFRVQKTQLDNKTKRLNAF